MPSLNSCAFIGNLGKDPEMRYTEGGKAITQFSLAVNRNHKDAAGEWQQETEWVRVVCWAPLAERVAEYLRKGRLAYVEGRMQTRSWVGKDDGAKHYATEIVAGRAFALDKRPEDGEDLPRDPAAPAAPAAAAEAASDLDDLPF